MQTLFNEFRRQGFTLAYFLLGNADDAADAVQEGLRVAWTHREEWDAGRDPKAWFFRVLRNHCIDQLRRRGVRRQVQVENLDAVDGAAPGPEALAEDREFHRQLARALQDLDPQQREIIILRDHQQLSYAEIATILEVPDGTVMSRLHRARLALREQMKNYL